MLLSHGPVLVEISTANETNWFKSRIFWCGIEIENRLFLFITIRDSSSVFSYAISPESRIVCIGGIYKIMTSK
jgi:hypothetical protein